MQRQKFILELLPIKQSIVRNLTSFRIYTINKQNISTAKATSSTSNSQSKLSNNETLIYQYKNVDHKLRTFFWGNMFYIYGNSILFHFELFEPTIGYFHGLMLSLSLVVGWGCFFVVGSIAHKTVYRIYKFNDYLGRTKYRVTYLSYYKTEKEEILSHEDLIDYTQSNIEGFIFVRNRNNKYKKIYVNPNKNLLEYDEKLNEEFKKFIMKGSGEYNIKH